jgi:uncharacterized protein YdhG (YjbR/CyaY superfamily)
MRTAQPAPENIDEYMEGFPKEVREALQKVRMTIHEAAPEAEEGISYKMPAFSLKEDPLVWFAAFKKHIGFYPAPVGVTEFKDDLSRYGSGKGTLQFPLDEPIPEDLISRVVKLRMQESLEKATGARKKKT